MFDRSDIGTSSVVRKCSRRGEGGKEIELEDQFDQRCAQTRCYEDERRCYASKIIYRVVSHPLALYLSLKALTAMGGQQHES